MIPITLCDVGPRDGLQNELDVLGPAVRADLVNRLAAAGVPRVEAVSFFVGDDRVPQMAGAEEVAAAIEPRAGTEYAGSSLNPEGGLNAWRGRGWAASIARSRRRSAFNRRNGNMSLDEALALRRCPLLSASELPRTVTVSCAFGCPFEGRVDPARVGDLCERARQRMNRPGGHDRRRDADAGPRPRRTCPTRPGESAYTYTTRVRPGMRRGGGDRGRGDDARRVGRRARRVPDAPKATGNIATEDIVYLLEGEGVATGVDLDALIAVSEWLEGVLGRRLEGYVYRAGRGRTAPRRGLERRDGRARRRPRSSASSRRRSGSRAAVPGRAAQPGGAALLDAAHTSSVARPSSKPNEHLVQDDVVEDLDARQPRELLGEAARVRAAALDELGDAAAAERAQRRVDGEAARAARELRRPVDLRRARRPRRPGSGSRRWTPSPRGARRGARRTRCPSRTGR